ncbi:MAG: hypothetical protein ACODAU_12545 [Myxococcota bacterium]
MIERASAWALLCLGMVGCAAMSPRDPEPASAGAGVVAAGDEEREEAPDATSPFDARLAELPPAPWSGELLADGEAPEELVGAWRAAGNRGRCAPMAPALVRGVAARAVPLDGGWAVAFDAPGRRGVMPDGHPCRRCGTGAYGIAGTAATADEWRDLGPANLEPTFRDGSLAELRVHEEDTGAATATLAVAGQRCVYQVWSFLGEDHLRDLLSGLRFVAVRDAEDAPRMAGLPRSVQ